jgi:demethylmenaquinone methyltransferase / 2-methoxy-6-polyprenyl-1,4-benzoquinol methylase
MRPKQLHSWTGPDAGAAKAAYVRSMFARIVPRYDLINRLMTMGLDRRWRRLTAELVAPKGALALDLATGTGDLALELKRQGSRFVAGADFCPEMLVAAVEKVGRSSGGAISFLAGDAQELPFADDTFDCLVNGFLLRNVSDLGRALREFRRVLKPGGRLACLDLTHPPRFLRPLFWPWFRLVVPLMGAMIGGDRDAYTYLPDSLRTYPDAERLRDMMLAAGLSNATFRHLAMGAVAIHTAVKPSFSDLPNDSYDKVRSVLPSSPF